MNTKTKGYLLGAVAAATYGMNPLFALPLYQAGLSTDSVLFYRYILAIPMLAGLILWRGRSFRIRAKEILPLTMAGILMALSSITLFSSYNYMEAGVASTLLFIYPILVALIMAIFFHEKITLETVICILLALGGIGLLYQNADGSVLNTTGVLLVLASALSYAIYIVSVNQSVLREVSTVRLTFYCLVVGSLIFLARLDFGQELQAIPRWYFWGNVLALAAFPTVISFLCTTQATHYIGPTPTAILGALEPVTAVIFGVTVFGESLTPRLILGMLLIILAVTLIVTGGRFSQTLIRFRKLFPRIRRRI